MLEFLGNNTSPHLCADWLLRELPFINYIARKLQGKSVSSDLLMNINDLGAMAVSSQVQSI